jgi:hypothetical protein
MKAESEYIEINFFPKRNVESEQFGINFSGGGAHISKTMMLNEIEILLNSVQSDASLADYINEIVKKNVLNKKTESTRFESMRRLRSLYSLNGSIPIFDALRKLSIKDSKSIPLLALLVVWSRDPFFRSTTRVVIETKVGEYVDTSSLANAFEDAYPMQYSESSKGTTARNCSSTWAQAGYLIGHRKKQRIPLKITPAVITLALYIGYSTGFQGSSVFDNPWCKLLCVSPDRVRTLGQEAHKLGFLNLMAIGEVVQIEFPHFLTKFGESI